MATRTTAPHAAVRNRATVSVWKNFVFITAPVLNDLGMVLAATRRQRRKVVELQPFPQEPPEGTAEEVGQNHDGSEADQNPGQHDCSNGSMRTGGGFLSFARKVSARDRFRRRTRAPGRKWRGNPRYHPRWRG